MRCNRFYAAMLMALLLVPAAPAQADNGLFGTDERRSSRLKSFPKWTDMLRRQEGGNSGQWDNFISGLRGHALLSQVRAVNAEMNAHRYIVDPINWGVPDYWATPFQFFIKNGDCEDYAISKYMSLRALGVSEDDLRIVVLEDKNLGIMHAVLAVYDGDDIYILDNQIKSVVKDTAIHHYKPIYSINESAWWRHK